MDEKTERERALRTMSAACKRMLADWINDVKRIVGAPNRYAPANKMPIGRP